jgi:hypothetical protein
MDIKTDISSDKIKIFFKDFFEKIPSMWDRGYKILFVFIFLLCVGFAGFVWRKSISTEAKWGTDKKEEFLKSQENGVVFKQNDFNKAVLNVDNRNEKFNADLQLKKNIFLP